MILSYTFAAMYLQPGDTIGIVSPARAIPKEKVQPAVSFLESQGFNVKVGNHVFNVHNQMAGTEDEKVEDIQNFIDDPSIKAIISTRGGYGCVRVIDHLNLKPLADQNKWFIGYSDVTVFHSHIHTQFDVPTIHGTMPVNITSDPSSEEQLSNKSLIDCLVGNDITYSMHQHQLTQPGNAEGVLVGGNLSMLYSLCGSESDIQTAGKILFLEDLDEYLYHVDRMMMNLKRTGKLSDLAGLIIGGMSDMNDNTIPFGKTAEEIILEHTQAYNYPIYFGFDAGHQQPNLAMRFGMKARISDNQLILPA